MIRLLGNATPCHGSTLHSLACAFYLSKAVTEKRERSSATRTAGAGIPREVPTGVITSSGRRFSGTCFTTRAYLGFFGTGFLRYGNGRDHSEWLGAAICDFLWNGVLGWDECILLLPPFVFSCYFRLGQTSLWHGKRTAQKPHVKHYCTGNVGRNTHADRKKRARLGRPRRTGGWMDPALSRPPNW